MRNNLELNAPQHWNSQVCERNRCLFASSFSVISLLLTLPNRIYGKGYCTHGLENVIEENKSSMTRVNVRNYGPILSPSRLALGFSEARGSVISTEQSVTVVGALILMYAYEWVSWHIILSDERAVDRNKDRMNCRHILGW